MALTEEQKAAMDEIHDLVRTVRVSNSPMPDAQLFESYVDGYCDARCELEYDPAHLWGDSNCTQAKCYCDSYEQGYTAGEAINGG